MTTGCKIHQGVLVDGDHRTIWRLDEVVDTRVYDFEAGKPDPTTGDVLQCDCCGKNIVIHAYVHLWDMKDKRAIASAVIGTACCKKYDIRSPFFAASTKSYWKHKYPPRLSRTA